MSSTEGRTVRASDRGRIVPADDASLARAASILLAGGLVAFPTETVYGLGADASQPDAVRAIFAAKGRPADHPVIVHVADASWLANWTAHVPDEAQALTDAFWPGPLTLVLTRSRHVSDAITGGGSTIGLRCPAHPVARALLNRVDRALAAPSANRFGRISPTTAEHVSDELGDTIDLIVDGGPADVGVESTIVDLSGSAPRLLRPGGVSLEALEDVLDRKIATAGGEAPRAPGTLASHYAPDATTLALSREDLLSTAVPGDAVLVFGACPDALDATCAALPLEPRFAARQLYATLRRLDAAAPRRIRLERPPDTPAWRTVRDRLVRAAGPR